MSLFDVIIFNYFYHWISFVGSFDLHWFCKLSIVLTFFYCCNVFSNFNLSCPHTYYFLFWSKLNFSGIDLDPSYWFLISSPWFFAVCLIRLLICFTPFSFGRVGWTSLFWSALLTCLFFFECPSVLFQIFKIHSLVFQTAFFPLDSFSLNQSFQVLLTLVVPTWVVHSWSFKAFPSTLLTKEFLISSCYEF